MLREVEEWRGVMVRWWLGCARNGSGDRIHDFVMEADNEVALIKAIDDCGGCEEVFLWKKK